MARAPDAASTAVGDRVKPYRIRVSTRYLDLTRRKLELTRLPHPTPQTRSSGWWEPQPTVEPLVDYWLERFSWREHEQDLNARVPQFRTALSTAALETAVRLHFVHATSRHAHALPLLLIPPFPFTNLSLAHLIAPFTEPADAARDQPFHLVLPSLPGLGFSDGLPDSVPAVPTMAHLLDALMQRLGYDRYLVTNSGPSPSVLAPVDWKVADHLARHYPGSCLGVHAVSPPLAPPRIRHSPMAWAKWKLASVLGAPILGYSRQDLEATTNTGALAATGSPRALLGFGSDGAYEPNTLAYALCDSPLGLLLFFLMVLRISTPYRGLPPAEIIKMTELTWLPGPEGTVRLWAQCVSGDETHEGNPGQRPRAAITVFSGDQGGDEPVPTLLPRPMTASYVCPAWGCRHYRVVACNRVEGRPGLLAWERPQVIVTGARRLAKAIFGSQSTFVASEASTTASPKRAAVQGGQNVAAATSGTAATASESASSSTGQRLGGLSVRETREQSALAVICQRVDEEEEAHNQGSDGDGSRDGSPDTVIAVQIRP